MGQGGVGHGGVVEEVRDKVISTQVVIEVKVWFEFRNNSLEIKIPRQIFDVYTNKKKKCCSSNFSWDKKAQS